jgi:hypothetical protein
MCVHYVMRMLTFQQQTILRRICYGAKWDYITKAYVYIYIKITGVCKGKRIVTWWSLDKTS